MSSPRARTGDTTINTSSSIGRSPTLRRDNSTPDHRHSSINTPAHAQMEALDKPTGYGARVISPEHHSPHDRNACRFCSAGRSFQRCDYRALHWGAVRRVLNASGWVIECLPRGFGEGHLDQDDWVSLNPPTQYATDANLRARQRLWEYQQPSTTGQRRCSRCGV